MFLSPTVKRGAGILVLLVAACSRDDDSKQAAPPIEVKVLPTARSRANPEIALSGNTPIPAHGPPTVAPKAPPTEPRPGFVPKGTSIRSGPSAEAKLLGTFQGKTNVEVLEAEGDFTRVKAPVVDGGSVEGWVTTSSIQAPEAKVGSAPAGQKPPPPSGGAKSPAAASAEKPKHAAAPAKKGGDKGPDDILLQPIAGTAKKRPATPFTHKKHYDDYSVKCEDCHHPVKAKGGAVGSNTCSAAGCHGATECNGQAVPAKNKACPFFEDAFHQNCIDCHRKQSGPTKCAECHTTR